MIVKCIAPIRICDLGGWTDTWFAKSGCVLNIAVSPCVEVTIISRKRRKGDPQVTIRAENYHDTYTIDPQSKSFGKHPLIEAAFTLFKMPSNISLDVTIFSEAPVGASTGTSAAVSVALIGALDLMSGRKMTTYDIAQRAHYIETKLLHLQAGVQDQLCSACGGINFLDIRYPDAAVCPLQLTNGLLWELESRLLLIYLGKPHHSSALHESVIDCLEQSEKFKKRLVPLRTAAVFGKEALLRGDLDAFGYAMRKNTEAQRGLHPELIGERADYVIDMAKKFKLSGYKVNGAGGEGGSITLLLPSGSPGKRKIINAIVSGHTEFQNIPIQLAPHGLRRWVTTE